jgi:hypothetical protein
MQLPIALLADYANITGDGKLNVMGLFTDINAPRFPARHAGMFLVLKFSLELGEVQLENELTVRLEDEDGQRVGELVTPLVFAQNERGDRLDHNHIIHFRDIIIPRPGRYQFSVYVNAEILGTVPLRANIILEEG